MIKRILTVVCVLVLTSSCAWFDTCESFRQGELRFEHLFPQAEVRPSVEPRVTLPEKCRKYYQDGTENWINCMGVGYK